MNGIDTVTSSTTPTANGSRRPIMFSAASRLTASWSRSSSWQSIRSLSPASFILNSTVNPTNRIHSLRVSSARRISGFTINRCRILDMVELQTIAQKAEEAGLPFLVIGGYAVMAHGFVRSTDDLDILVQASRRQRWREFLESLGMTLY